MWNLAAVENLLGVDVIEVGFRTDAMSGEASQSFLPIEPDVVPSLDRIPDRFRLPDDRGVVVCLNLISYDMAFSKKGLQQYLKKYKRKLIPSENGKTYLPTGGYNIVVKGTSVEQKTAFSVIEKNNNSQP